MFAAKLPSISWVPSGMLAASRRRYAGGINARSIPRDLVVFSEPAQYRFVNTLPYTCLHPFVQTTPAGHSATAPKLTRQIFPWYSSPKDEQNSGQCRPVTDAWSTTFRRRRMHWKISCDKGPEFIGNECLGHGISPAKNMPSMLMPRPWPRTAEIDRFRSFGLGRFRPTWDVHAVFRLQSAATFSHALWYQRGHTIEILVTSVLVLSEIQPLPALPACTLENSSSAASRALRCVLSCAMPNASRVDRIKRASSSGEILI